MWPPDIPPPPRAHVTAAIGKYRQTVLVVHFFSGEKMPPKLQTKRKRQLVEDAKKGREARKMLRLSMMGSRRDKISEDPSGNDVLKGPRSSRLDTDLCLPGTSSTPSINPSGNAPPDDILRTFSEHWKLTLDQEDMKSLALFLCHIFTAELKMPHSKAAEHTAKIIGRTERTIRQWRSDLVAYGEIRESQKGKYERPKLLWANKELNDKARAFVQTHTAFMVQGKQSMMKAKDFCQWVNETLLPNQAMASLYSFVPGYGYAPVPSGTTTGQALPHKISKETARKWLRELGL